MPQPLDKPVTSWTQLFAAFPIQKPQHLNAAVGYLLAQLAGPGPHSRTKAWLSYCCATALLDRWPNSDLLWGILRNLPRGQLRQRTLAFSAESIAELPPDPEDYAYTFDVYWAAGFLSLHERHWGAADNYWNDALNLRPDQAELVADYADALVFFGMPTVARFMATHAIGMQPPNTVPHWLRWVEAWAYVGIAALHWNRRPDKARGAAEHALAALPAPAGVHDNGIPWDLDVTITRMMANHVLGNHAENALLWPAFRSVVNGYKGLQWNRALEIDRSPFHTRGSAQRLLALMQAAIPA